MEVNRPVILILNSAHSKYPMGSDPWIQASVNTVKHLAGQGVTFLTSTHPLPWDLVTALAGINTIENIHMVFADDSPEGRRMYEAIINDFGLNESSTHPYYLGKLHGRHPKLHWQSRDRTAFEKADIIYPVSIRPGGRLDLLLACESFRSKVKSDYAIPWSCGENRERIPVYNFTGCTVNPLPTGSWLIHWTRSSPCPWPGERASEFFRDLLDNPGVYVRSARETLVRMLSERMIRASSWKMPGGTPAVSFTSLPAEESPALMRWRKRFVRYSLEPYGLAVKTDALIELGAREVLYDAKLRETSERLFVQSPGARGNWTLEREWRICGNISLDSLPDDDYRVIVPDERESEMVSLRVHRPSIRFHILFNKL